MAMDANSKLEAGNLFTVNGLVVVITGGGSGLGQMMARALALNGAKKVFIIGRRAEALQNTVASMAGTKAEDVIVPLVGDITSKESLTDCVEMVKAQSSHIDVLVANAGILGPKVPMVNPQTQKPLPIEEVISNMWSPSTEAIASIYTVNLVGIHLTIAAFLPLLHAANLQRSELSGGSELRPRPQIITTSSIAGFHRLSLDYPMYGPSKAGVLNLTKQLANSLVPYDIRVNSIAPGVYPSEANAPTFKGIDDIKVEGTFPKALLPATRSGDEQDMAGVILWLCSRAGAYVNGNIVVTDGGRLGMLPSSY